MKIFDNLTDLDKEMIEDYIQYYAEGPDGESDKNSKCRASLSYILRKWDDNKEELYHKFGDEFIIEEEVEMTLSENDIQDNLARMLCDGENVFDIRKTETIDIAKNFYKELRKRLCSNFMLLSATNLYTLAQNEYIGETIEIENSTIKIQKGSKPARYIAKLAKHFGLEGFEEFRIVHSLALNNKVTKGTLCLSIHPLDYMTMSDNWSDWDSCMSWMNNGCYRLGTVEMMNSPYVVVAYLKSDEDMEICYRYKWNNKKWRKLFIVTEDIITGVKGYPYENRDLDVFCLDKLATLFGKENYCDEIIEIEPFTTNTIYNVSFDGKSKDLINICFNFKTDRMFPDLTKSSVISCYIGDSIQDGSRITVNYSGDALCMWCGDYIDDQDSLLCETCSGYERIYCDSCGESMHSGNEYTLDDNTYCYSCYQEFRVEAANDSRYNEHDINNCFKMVIYDEETGKMYRVCDRYCDDVYFYAYTQYTSATSVLNKDYVEYGIYYPFGNPSVFRVNYVTGGETLYIKGDIERYKEFLDDFGCCFLEEDDDNVTINKIRWYKN